MPGTPGTSTRHCQALSLSEPGQLLVSPASAAPPLHSCRGQAHCQGQPLLDTPGHSHTLPHTPRLLPAPPGPSQRVPRPGFSSGGAAAAICGCTAAPRQLSFTAKASTVVCSWPPQLPSGQQPRSAGLIIQPNQAKAILKVLSNALDIYICSSFMFFLSRFS